MKVLARPESSIHNGLTPGKVYRVVGFDHDSYRVVDDKAEPILFPKNTFDVVDDSVPGEWVWRRYGDDEYYVDPPEFAEPGFYEDYFDGKQYARERFEAYISRTHDR